MATTRLRQTFRYPGSDSDNENEGIDEQEQEALLSSLANRDTRNTTLYTLLFLVLPLAPIPLHFPLLLHTSTFLQALLSIVTFLASAYILYYMPLPPVPADTTPTSTTSHPSSRKGKAILRDPSGHRTTSAPSFAPASPLSAYLSPDQLQDLHFYILVGSRVITFLLAAYELFYGKGWKEGMQIGGGCLPGFIFYVVLWAREELRVVDLGGLERLRYRFKGV